MSKVIVFTGATSGLGVPCAKQLAAQGHRLAIIARSQTKGKELLDSLQSPKDNAKHSLYLGDMGTLEDVKRLVSEIKSKEPKIDILINNAGAIIKDYKENAQGVNETVALNHLGPFVLTLGLKDSLHNGSRVVITSSQTHGMVKFDANDLNAKTANNPLTRYGRSKLYSILFARSLAEKWKPDGIQVLCFHPGLVSTGFGAGNIGGVFEFLSNLSYRFMGISAEKGGDNLTYMATSKDLDGLTGEYFDEKKRAKPSKDAQNDEYAKILWDQSVKWAGL